MMEQEDIPRTAVPHTAPTPDDEQDRPAVVLHIEEGFLEGVLCFLRRAFGSGGGILCRFFGWRISFA